MELNSIPEPPGAKITQLDLLRARELTLKAALAITRDARDEDLVLANAAPIETFLLSDLTSWTRLKARCSAVSYHLEHLARSLLRDQSPAVLNNPEEFLRIARRYAEFLNGQTSDLLQVMFRRQIGIKGQRLALILRDSGGTQDATPTRLADLLSVRRSVIMILLSEAERAGLVSPTEQTWPCTDEQGHDQKESSWVLSSMSQEPQP